MDVVVCVCVCVRVHIGASVCMYSAKFSRCTIFAD